MVSAGGAGGGGGAGGEERPEAYLRRLELKPGFAR